jgi:phospholipase/carboxylesterase
MAAVLPCVEVGPRGEADGAVVWLHGLGADGHDFEPVVPMLRLPRVRFVFPNAPLRAVTINGGMVMPAWYDILSLGRGGGGEDEAGVRESAREVSAILAREKQRGVPPERTVLAGFSQGAALALHVGVRHPERLAGILVLSGYEVLAATREGEASPANRRTPMFFGHGTDDPVVPLEGGRAAYTAYAAAGREAVWREYEMGHSVSPEEIEDVAVWLAERLR